MKRTKRRLSGVNEHYIKRDGDRDKMRAGDGKSGETCIETGNIK